MRKLSLLAAAAMVAGGSAFAMDGGGVSISGEANFGVKFKENDGGANAPNELQFHHEFDIKFAASGTTDGGIGFGGSVSIDNTESVSLATKPGTAATVDRSASVIIVAAGTVDDATQGENVAILAGAGDHYVTLNAEGHITTANTTEAEGHRIFHLEDLEAGDLIIVGSDGVPIAIRPGVGDDDDNWILHMNDGASTTAAAGAATLYQVGPSDIRDLTAATPASVALGPNDSHKIDNHGEVYISMDMHKLTIGTDLDRADQLAGGLADPGFDGIGIDDVAEAVWGKTARDVRYDGDFGVAKVAITYGDNKGDAEWAAGFSFNVEPVTFGAGFDSNGVMSVGMGFSQGQIAMNALYSTDSDWHEDDNEMVEAADGDGPKAPINYNLKSNMPDLKNQAMGVDMTYQMSEATSLVLVAAQHKRDNIPNAYFKTSGTGGSTSVAGRAGAIAGDQGKSSDLEQVWAAKSSTTVDAFGVGFSHDLGGGATLKAGAGSVDSNAVADLGITMKF